MNNNVNDILNNLSRLLKEDSEEINNLLGNMGITKEEALKRIQNTDNKTLVNELNNETIMNKLNNLSVEDKKKLNNIKKLFNDTNK